MHKNIEEIIERAQQIKRLAESEHKLGNLETAENYAGILQKLLLKHKLSMSDIEFERHLEEEIGKDDIKWWEYKMPLKAKREAWVINLALTISKAYGCVLVQRIRSNILTLCGHKSNREIAEFTIILLVRAVREAVELEYRKFYYECKKEGDTRKASGFRAAFVNAFNKRIEERFSEEKIKKQGQEQGSENALIRVGREIQKTEEWMKNNYKTKLGYRPKGHSGDNEFGAASGEALANKVDIHGKAVGNTMKRSRQIE